MMTEKLAAVRRFRLGVVVGMIALVVFVAAVLGGAYLRTAALETTCEKINGVQAILSTILVRSETISLKHPSPEFSEAQVRAYYDRALKELEPAEC